MITFEKRKRSYNVCQERGQRTWPDFHAYSSAGITVNRPCSKLLAVCYILPKFPRIYNISQTNLPLSTSSLCFPLQTVTSLTANHKQAKVIYFALQGMPKVLSSGGKFVTEFM
jgi:hypothetical protein